MTENRKKYSRCPKPLCKVFFILIIFFATFPKADVTAQFYNGLNMDFGKNRVQYNGLYWQYYRFKRFDSYFHADSKELAEFASEVVHNQLTDIESFFEYQLQHRIILIVYSKHSYFKQSNIGLVSDEEQNIGGVTRIVNNKVFVYYEGDKQKFIQQIRAAIVEVVLNEMLYGGKIKDRVASSTLLNLPEWYIKGLISYLSVNWDFTIENKVKDGILSKNYKRFNGLSGEDAVYAGHSIWNFIACEFGKSVIPNILYLTKVNRNYESGFIFVLGVSLKDLAPEWKEFYISKYKDDEKSQTLPEDKLLRRTKKNTVYQQLKIHPQDKYIAYTTNHMGKYKIYIYDTETGKRRKILKKGRKLDQITDYSYPLLAWHPKGNLLTIMIEDKGSIKMLHYYVKTEKLVQRTLFKDFQIRKMFYFDKILDFSYSKDGMKLAVSATRKGQTDIYVFSMTSNTAKQITNDYADDFKPRFIEDDSKIVFYSNRKTNDVTPKNDSREKPNETFDLFVHDLKKNPETFTRITETPYNTETDPLYIDRNKYCFLSNKNGITNRFIANYDSTISHIDTAIHYRYFTKTYPLTNYKRNVLDYDICNSENKIAEIVFSDNRYRLYYDTFEVKTLPDSIDFSETDFRKDLTSTYILHDSLEAKKKAKLEKIRKQKEKTQDTVQQKDTIQVVEKPIHPDSILIDINNYVFEIEKKKSKLLRKAARLRDSLKQAEKADTFRLPKQHIYQTSFYVNKFVSQIDFNFLSSSYQAFTGGEVYFDPGGSLLMKVGAIDLFEDYRLTGAYRFSGSFDSNEYLVSLEDLKNRFDKQYIFHRQTYTETSEDATALINVQTTELISVLKFPFDQVTSLKGSLTLRYDRAVYKAIDEYTLIEPDIYKFWGGLKLEYIFDNTISRGLNLYNGTRFKLFGEFYNQLDTRQSDLFVIGADLRHYQKIHRDLIFAIRIAASTSFGHSRLIYYLGGVDNWTNFSSDVETFISLDEVPIDESQNFAFQAVATNMRGFPQNIRNGNSFVVLNNELRWPVFRYILNRPINSDFFNNFQVIGFGDIGTAWSGKSPYEDSNAYNTEEIDNPPVYIEIDKNNLPFVEGFGFGVRSRLLSYFIRLDWAWGIENSVIQDRIFYFSLDLDF